MNIKSFGIVALCLGTLAFVAKDQLKGVDVKSMNKKANPANDFNEYANGKWMKNNPVPDTEGRWTSFNILAEQNMALLHRILQTAAADTNAQSGSLAQKMGSFYRVAMDTAKLEADGISPINTDWYTIKVIINNDDVMHQVGRMQRKGIPAMFGMGVSPDIKNVNQNIAYFSQGGLSLPDRDYYLKQDEKSVEIRAEFVKHMTTQFGYFGLNGDESKRAAQQVLALETELAQASMSRVDRRDPDKTYFKFNLNEWVKQHPNINFKGYFVEVGLINRMPDSVVVSQPGFFVALNKLLATQSVQVWQNYLRWRTIQTASPYLHKVVANENFRFFGTILTGTKEQKPRWKRVVNAANACIGELVAQEYVKVAFSAESKRRLNEMVDNLQIAYRKRIENLDWMSPETKVKALEKLSTFKRKIGYPDVWPNSDNLEIAEESYLDNYYRANTFDTDDNLDKLGKPVDKTLWGMLPQTVNAYYSATMNEIVFPAAIMQPPFFDPNADDAVNYGAIGAVIGHEFSHGFDDKGSKFDAYGNLQKWWTDEDRKQFEMRTQRLVQQYNQFKVADSVFVNGALTLGENIADFAGLTVAYHAYQLSLANKPKQLIDGLTPEQRFFIGYAQVWRANARPEYLRQQVVTDTHSPAKFRVLGPLSNMPEFYEAFKVKPGDGMYRPDSVRAKIW